MRFLAPYSEQLYAVFRFVTGFLFTFHGLQKVFGMFGGQKAGAPLFLAAGWIELLGGILVAIGLFTPIVAFLCSGEMAVAYFMVHFKNGFWPIQNEGELAALYAFAFLYIAAKGGGIWSVDAMMRGRPRTP
jgi:putative oxidoreductase